MLVLVLLLGFVWGQVPCGGGVCLPTQYCSGFNCLDNLCDINASCAPVGYCDPTNDICLPKVCLGNTYCPNGFFCDLANSFLCKKLPPTCLSTPCPNGFYCSFVDCLPTQCNTTANCTRFEGNAYCDPVNKICLPGDCLSDSYCPPVEFFCNQSIRLCNVTPSAINCRPPANQSCPFNYWCTLGIGCLPLHCNTTTDCLGFAATGSFCDGTTCLPPTCNIAVPDSCPPGYNCNASFHCQKGPPTFAPTKVPSNAPTSLTPSATNAPTNNPTGSPTKAPTSSGVPTQAPTFAACSTVVPCPSGFYCSLANARCFPLQCTNNSQCQTSGVNNNGTCLDGACVPASCIQDPDCPPGFFCQQETATCQPSGNNNAVFWVILAFVIIMLLILILICFLANRRTRRY
jgi:hypothetical protein